MEPLAGQARERYEALVAAAPEAIAVFDMDGTLAPIVDDPEQARIHPRLPDLLVALGEHVRRVVVLTGRPARQALAIGGLDEVGERLAAHDRDLLVLGHYGSERWSASARRIVSPPPPAGLASFERELPRLLRRAGHPDTHVEEKGLAVALHTRRLPDPDRALADLRDPVQTAADRLGLAVEPGKQVLEVRARGGDKGSALRKLVEEFDPDAVLFAGDDLADIPAFEAVRDLREHGVPGLLVCSGDDGADALRSSADLVVDGPDGVADLLSGLVRDLAR